jgi:PadR family transcriptional regulator PadR
MGTSTPRITKQTLSVLGAFTSSQHEALSGAEIARKTMLQSGTLYPILSRLEHANWLESRWEIGDPSKLGRPRRRFYQLTGLGYKSAIAAYKDVSDMIGGLTWELS